MRPKSKLTADGYHLEHSAGGIVYRLHEGQIEVAIAYRTYHHDWTLPKGHLEDDETIEQAALREVEEETGMICEIVSHVGSSTYRFRERKQKKNIEKRVDYFLMKLIKDKGQIQLEEVDKVEWFPFLQAIKKLTFKPDQDLVKQAVAKIQVVA